MLNFERIEAMVYDARQSIEARLDAIHLDIRRLFFIVSQGDRKLMADIDTLTTLAQGMQVDEDAEDKDLAQMEASGVAIQAAVTVLEQEAAVNPNLQPVIAMLTAQKAQADARLAKMQADAASGSSFAGSLPQPGAATAAASGAATVAPAPATPAGTNQATATS